MHAIIHNKFFLENEKFYLCLPSLCVILITDDRMMNRVYFFSRVFSSGRGSVVSGSVKQWRDR